MSSAPQRSLLHCCLLWLAALTCLELTGCVAAAVRAVPATRLPPELRAPRRDALAPIDFTLLRQPPPQQYVIAPGDVLGIYVQDVLPATPNSEPNINYPFQTQSSLEFAGRNGNLQSPAVGTPIHVEADGTVQLPLTKPLRLSGLTMPQAVERLKQTYTIDNKVLKPGKERIIVSLVRPRYTRVMVLREDAPAPNPSLINKQSTVLSKKGSAQVLDLPAYENDVLHALIATGGLPGVDARNEVWVLRSGLNNPQWAPTVQQLQQGCGSRSIVDCQGVRRTYTKIPLRLPCGAAAPFNAQDVVLQDGDVLYVESREPDYFWTGGLLVAGQVPLPRDYDLDVVGAISLGNGAVGGPAGLNSVANNFRNGPGPIIAPTRVIIIRKGPDGEQLRIHCDLARAMYDAKERVIIQPGDLVMLQFTPSQYLGNLALNIFNFNYSVQQPIR